MLQNKYQYLVIKSASIHPRTSLSKFLWNEYQTPTPRPPWESICLRSSGQVKRLSTSTHVKKSAEIWAATKIQSLVRTAQRENHLMAASNVRQNSGLLRSMLPSLFSRPSNHLQSRAKGYSTAILSFLTSSALNVDCETTSPISESVCECCGIVALI